MPTHVTQCVICGENVYCCSAVHALGIGGDHGEGECDNPPYIEFCSPEHAQELQRRVAKGIQNYSDIYGEEGEGKL